VEVVGFEDFCFQSITWIPL